MRLWLAGAQGTVIALDGYPCEPFSLEERGVELSTTQRMDVLVDAGSDVFKLKEVKHEPNSDCGFLCS